MKQLKSRGLKWFVHGLSQPVPKAERDFKWGSVDSSAYCFPWPLPPFDVTHTDHDTPQKTASKPAPELLWGLCPTLHCVLPPGPTRPLPSIGWTFLGPQPLENWASLNNWFFSFGHCDSWAAVLGSSPRVLDNSEPSVALLSKGKGLHGRLRVCPPHSCLHLTFVLLVISLMHFPPSTEKCFIWVYCRCESFQLDCSSFMEQGSRAICKWR